MYILCEIKCCGAIFCVCAPINQVVYEWIVLPMKTVSMKNMEYILHIYFCTECDCDCAMLALRLNMNLLCLHSIALVNQNASWEYLLVLLLHFERTQEL